MPLELSSREADESSAPSARHCHAVCVVYVQNVQPPICSAADASLHRLVPAAASRISPASRWQRVKCVGEHYFHVLLRGGMPM